jgi:hypothetical protein
VPPYPYDTINTVKQDPFPKHTHLQSRSTSEEEIRNNHKNLEQTHLTTKTVKSASLSLKSIDDIKGGNSLALGVLGVCDCVADDTFKEGLENTSGFLVDH